MFRRPLTSFTVQVSRNALLGQTRCLSSQSVPILSLNDLSNIPGSVKLRKRWGRGVGTGRGKLCGYGHQKSGSTPRGFEGGQTPLYKRLPKIGFHNVSKRTWEIVNLDKIQNFIDQGRLVPKADGLLTMRDLWTAGVVTQIREGVKLLAKHKDELRSPVHFEVSSASKNAIAAVEAAGGTVTCVHFNRLALRALLKPIKFDLLPRRARPNPKRMPYFLDHTRAGYLSPEIQIRNLRLFGHVTSEQSMREEHDRYMIGRREQIKQEQLQRREQKMELMQLGVGKQKKIKTKTRTKMAIGKSDGKHRK